jgi:hypothetical protein
MQIDDAINKIEKLFSSPSDLQDLIKEFVGCVEMLTDPKLSNFNNSLNYQTNLSQLHEKAKELKKILGISLILPKKG